jgi:hypothetical protein
MAATIAIATMGSKPTAVDAESTVFHSSQWMLIMPHIIGASELFASASTSAIAALELAKTMPRSSRDAPSS